MIKRIRKEELPFELVPFFNNWKNYFTNMMVGVNLNPLAWEGEDKNLRAFNSKEEFLDWFCHHPEKPEPYRDYGFYTREFSFLSEFLAPKVIVELGTSLGIGTFMLSNLNPAARIYSVDCNPLQWLPGNTLCTVGKIALHNEVVSTQLFGNSFEAVIPDKFNMCFIDADHSGDSVYKDSLWAWENKDPDNYVIMWHDFNDTHLDFVGLINAVTRFSNEVEITVYKLLDSTTAWCYKRSRHG